VPVVVLVVLAAGGAVFAAVKIFGSGSSLFTLPASVDGMPRAASSAQVDAMRQNLHTTLPSAKVTAGAYQDPSDAQHQVILVGLEMPITNPEAQVSGGFAGFATTAPGLSTPKSYPPGPQGGAMECAGGDIGAAQVQLALCIVADQKGMIFVLDYSATEQHAADVTTGIRPSFERS